MISQGLITASLISIAVAAPSAAAIDQVEEFDFATAKIGEWDLKATTSLRWWEESGNHFAVVTEVGCRGENSQVTFSMNGAGSLTALRIRFLGLPDEDGDSGEITLLGDRLWLYVDGERWEYANIAKRTQLTNINYPAPTGDIILIWTGYQSVRRSEAGPWRNFSSLFERLIDAKKVEWGYKSRDWKVVNGNTPENRLPAGWERTRYPVDTKGLREAVSWCAAQVSSDAAYTLPPALKSTADN